MVMNLPYKAVITREQFLFHEMRIVAKLMMDGIEDKQIINLVTSENLFQYPTEKMIKNIARVCIARLRTIDSDLLVEQIARGSSESAKQICLYAMIKYYRIVYDFMVTVIGEKYRTKDYSYSKVDINIFFTRLQEQVENVSTWKVSTISKNKQVLTKLLVDNGYLDSIKSTQLNPILIDLNLKKICKERNEYAILAAFNCFE